MEGNNEYKQLYLKIIACRAIDDNRIVQQNKQEN